MPKTAGLWALPLLTLVVLTAGPAWTQHSQTHTIEIAGFKFVPESVQARVGDTVVFVNKDVVPHTATQQPAGWDSGSLAKDKSWTLKVEMAGAFTFFCRFHPSMKGSLTAE